MNKLNFASFINIKSNPSLEELQKAYQEGIYSDTPANRKLGRVGMTYKQYAEKTFLKDKEENIIETL